MNPPPHAAPHPPALAFQVGVTGHRALPRAADWQQLIKTRTIKAV